MCIDVILPDEVTAIFDESSLSSLMHRLLDAFKGRALIWLVPRASLAEEFDHTVVLERGKCVEQGPYSQLNRPGSVLNDLVATG